MRRHSRADRDADPFHDRLVDEPALAWRTVPGEEGFRQAFERLRSGTTSSTRLLAVVLAVVVSGPVAIGAAFVNNSAAGSGLLVLVPIVIAPVVEEIAKASGALYLAERKPWLVPAGWTLVLVSVASALVFATIENLYYLTLLIDDPSRAIRLVRWIGGTALHGSASFIAGLGVARMWRRCVRDGRPPDFADARPFLIGAMVIHGTWNLGATIVAVATSV